MKIKMTQTKNGENGDHIYPNVNGAQYARIIQVMEAGRLYFSVCLCSFFLICSGNLVCALSEAITKNFLYSK